MSTPTTEHESTIELIVERDYFMEETKQLREQLSSEREKCKQSRLVEQVCYDIHDALGIKWGDDPYHAIQQLRSQLADEWEKVKPLVEWCPVHNPTKDDPIKCCPCCEAVHEREARRPLVDALKESNGVLKVIYNHGFSENSKETIGEVIDRNTAALAKYKT